MTGNTLPPVTSTNILCFNPPLQLTRLYTGATQGGKLTIFLMLSMERARNDINPNLCAALSVLQSLQLLTIDPVTV